MQELGKSAIKVSTVSFGCMSLGDNQANIDHLLAKAIDNGINFFDTADIYDKGLNELRVGNALKSKRKDIIIATKVGNQMRADGDGWDWNPSKAYILKAVENSLRRLQTDYIDLYQLHGGTIEDPIDETIEAFELLKQQGKIRSYGISSIRPNVIREYVKHANIVSVMMQYSLLDTRPEESVLSLLEKHQISVITRGSLAQGMLIGAKPADHYLQFTSSEVSKATKAIALLAEAKSLSKNTLATSYVLSHKPVASAVTGIRTEEQLDQAIDALRQHQDLSNADLDTLKKQVRTFYYEQHR